MKSLDDQSWSPRFLALLQAERDAVVRNRVRYASVLDLQPETMSKDQVAVVGVDGSMFVGNGSNKWEHQYVGETRLSDQGIAKWRHAFERRRAAAHEIGARYLHLVIPEKQSIMPTARWPNGVVKRVGPRPIEQIGSLGMPELLYPLPALQSQAWRAELAWRGDSHWCTSGMWFIFMDLMARLWPERVFPFEALLLARTWRQHDLVGKFTAARCWEDVITIGRRAAVVSDNRLRARTGKQIGNQYVLGHPAALYDECVVVFGDSHSYDMGLSDVLSTYFRRLHFIWDTSVDFDYCRRVGATLVLTEGAERYLARPPKEDVVQQAAASEGTKEI